MEEAAKELTLLLLYLTSWEEEISTGYIRRSWKTHRFEILDELQEEGYIRQTRGKSVFLTGEGEKLAGKLKEKYIPK